VSARLTPDFERTLRRYVLGQLDEPLQAELEEMLVSDQDGFEALGVVEDELVEGYLDGSLSEAERVAFERHFLTSPKREGRLSFARALRGQSAGGAAGRFARPVRVFGIARPQTAWIGLAAVLAVSLAGNVWLVSRTAGPAGGLESPPAGPPAPTPVAAARGPELAELGAALAREQAARAGSDARAARLESELTRARAGIVSYALAAGRLRSTGESARLTLPREAVAVRLRLELAAADHPSYRAEIFDQEGELVWAASKLISDEDEGEAAVVLVLPAGLLAAGDYEVSLSGAPAGSAPEVVGTYAFGVAKR
jgi:hypothetical protein